MPLLHDAYRRHALSLAGPALPLAEETAWQAAELLAAACWKLVSDSTTEPLPNLMVRQPSAADHLSADLTMRYLPSVYRRAMVRELTVPLAAELENVLRFWPLSGVLADLDDEPSTLPEFDGHPGLQLLYAERLVKTAQAGWVPKGGLAREWAERVFHERGRSLPTRPDSREDHRA